MKKDRPRRQTGMNQHHRNPKSLGGNGKPDNIILVNEKLHAHYHALFGNMNPYEVAAYLTQVWIDPRFVLVAVPK